jgi:hypothetical protein
MKASELVSALQHEIECHGDVDVTISCDKPKVPSEQSYIISEPNFVVFEDRGPDGQEIMLRDWPY